MNEQSKRLDKAQRWELVFFHLTGFTCFMDDVMKQVTPPRREAYTGFELECQKKESLWLFIVA
jgi:hypothetical protein